MMEKYKVIISSKAQTDLANCISFVLNVSKEASIDLANSFYSSFDSLTTFPERNPIFEMPKSFPYQIHKQIINGRYIALYAIQNDKVIIYRILDSRRKFDYLIK